MGLLKVYVMLLFGISIGLYLSGYTSPLLQIATTTNADISVALLNSFLGIFTNVTFLAILGATAVASYLTSGGNMSITYLFPIFLIMALMNFFILPTSFILALELDPFIKILVAGFLNLMLGLAMVEFIRSGG
jgi:hypothetical protein